MYFKRFSQQLHIYVLFETGNIELDNEELLQKKGE